MEETKRRRFIIRAVLEGEVDVQEAPQPEWTEIASLSSEDLTNGGLSNNYGSLTPYIDPTRRDRVSLMPFNDISEYVGYTMKVEYEFTGTPDVYFGVNTYNQTAMTAVGNHFTIRGSDSQAHGWYESGDTFVIEPVVNNSPVVTYRINFSRGAAHNQAVDNTQITNIHIYVKNEE